jgi:hypothetical protein
VLYHHGIVAYGAYFFNGIYLLGDRWRQALIAKRF